MCEDDKLEMLRAFVDKLDKEFEAWVSTREITALITDEYYDAFYDAFDYAFRAGYMAGVDRGMEMVEEADSIVGAWEVNEEFNGEGL